MRNERGQFIKGSIPVNKGVHKRTNTGRTHFKKGNPGPWLGKKRSSETIDKIIQKRKGQRVSISTEFKKGQIPWNLGLGTLSTEDQIIRHRKIYTDFRKAVLRRDEYICQICDKPENTAQVNHIKRFAHYPNLRTDIKNGITLCKSCHIMIRGHEEEWESYFNFNLITRGFLPDTNWVATNEVI